MKLLINRQDGVQELITVGDGGGYFYPARILWHEKTDGPLPAITLGGMVRQDNQLVFSDARMTEHSAAKRVVDIPLLKAAVKAEAQRRIIALFQNATLGNYHDKELTALMRHSRLLKKKEAGTINAGEQIELDAIDARFGKTLSIIGSSSLIESDIDAAADPASVPIVDNTKWPA